MPAWSRLYQIIAKKRCPFCQFPLDRDRTGSHLVWCLHDVAVEIVFGDAARNAFPALRRQIALGLD